MTKGFRFRAYYCYFFRSIRVDEGLPLWDCGGTISRSLLHQGNDVNHVTSSILLTAELMDSDIYYITDSTP